MQWDIFCRVIDNFGDIGVCWRLSADLAARGQQVRLWVDDASALDWMAPGARTGHSPGVQVLDWRLSANCELLETLPPAQVWIEGFGCEIEQAFIAHFAARAAQPCWINLEYLSAEAYVERCHGLPSPLMSGPARGWTRHFFYPGFTASTGGLLREPDLAERQRAFCPQVQEAWLQTRTGTTRQGRYVSLFCYEPPQLAALLDQLAASEEACTLLVTADRAAQAVRGLMGVHTARGQLSLCYLPPLSQREYDELLWCCDLNFVRGEDSLVRALWAGKPLVWHIYPQQDGAHAAKLEAFMQTLDMPAGQRELMRSWNGLQSAPLPWPAWSTLQDWAAHALAARARLLGMADLGSQLLGFVQKKR